MAWPFGKRLITRRRLLAAATAGFAILANTPLLAALHGQSGPPLSVALTDVPSSGIIFQRTGSAGQPFVSGTFTGGLPYIECQVRQSGSVVVAWTRLTSENQGGGVWSGYGPSVPASADIIYTFEVRCRDNHALTQAGTHLWGIGDNYVCHGQSNMGSFCATGDGTVTPLAGTYVITGNNQTPIGSRAFAPAGGGNALLTFLNASKTATGFCCCGMNISVPATNIDFLFGTYWDLPTASDPVNFPAAKDLIKVFFNSFANMLWLQGENQFQYSASTLTNEAYLGSLQTGMTKTVALAGRAVKIFMISIGRSIDPAFPADAVNNPNQQQNYITAANLFTDFYYVGCNMDCTFAGTEKIHWDADSGTRIGKRTAQSFLKILGLSTTPVAPFFPTSGSIFSTTQTDITLTHSAGTDFTPTTNIANFEVSEDGFTWITATGARQAANIIRLTHAALGTACRFWRHAWSTFADPVNYVHDNSTIQSALNFSTPVVQLCTNSTCKAPVLQSQVDQVLNNSGPVTVTGSRQRISAKNGDKLVYDLSMGGGSVVPSTVVMTPDVGSPISFTKTVGTNGNGGSIWEVDLVADINLSTLWTVVATYPSGVFTTIGYSLYVLPGYAGITSSGTLMANGTVGLPPTGSITTRAGGITIGSINAQASATGAGHPAHADAIILTATKAFTNDTVWAGTICAPTIGFGASVNNPGGPMTVTGVYNQCSGNAFMVAASW